MSTHNIGFYEELTKIIFQLSSNKHFICSFELSSKSLVIIRKAFGYFSIKTCFEYSLE